MNKKSVKIIVFSLIALIIIGVVIFLSKKNNNNNNIQNSNQNNINNTIPNEVEQKIKAGLNPERIEQLTGIIKGLEEKVTAKIAISPDYITLGINYLALGDLQKALDNFIIARDLNPDYYLAHSNIGTIYQMRKEYDKADENFKIALEKHPTFAPTFIKLAELYQYDMNKSVDSMKYFYLEALKRTGDNIDVAKKFASYLEDQGLLEDELKMWQGILELQPDDKSIKDKISEIEKELEKQTN
jgi:tetratricopeptide (TPR) repeat protein